MKQNLLLYLMLLSGILCAQEPYRQLMITEALYNDWDDTYVEITNMGDQTVNLSEFKFGVLPSNQGGFVYDVFNDPFEPPNNYWFMMPDHELAPGESYVITGAYDFGPEQYAKDPRALGAVERPNRSDIYEVADLMLHFPEDNGDETDSVTTMYPYQTMHLWGGSYCLYLEHHFVEGDSAVVDQVGGVFDDDGRNTGDPYDVAGVEDATYIGPLIRKFKVKTGNLDFANARGVGADDSEWIAIPFIGRGYNSIWNWRDTWWTVGNHGGYVLDENTLESDVIDVDFAAKTLTVPWGVRRIDGIMHQFKKKQGIAWDYILNANVKDSLYRSAQTGDKLIIYVCGDELHTDTFDITVSEPTEDANIVVPIDHRSGSLTGPVTSNTQAGILSWIRATEHENGIDTITAHGKGIDFAMRVDTMLQYLEKPPKATWEIVWVDGITRADVKNGDKLKVIAENGDVKEYFIQVQPYITSHNAYLSSITWPDIPDFYRGIFGWIGDTIPGFGNAKLNYKITVPLDVEGVPALLAKTQDLNSKVDVMRATSLAGTVEDRTVTFTVTAEDDSVTNVYTVEMNKQKDPAKVQPYYAEPFLAEFIYQEMWSNGYAELANPGNQPLDLSHYMITATYSVNPADHITQNMGTDEWHRRFMKYVPGYKWVSEDKWAITPGVLEPDLNVNPIVQPGDVFTMGTVQTGIVTQSWVSGYIWPPLYELDVQFRDRSDELTNPWNEPVGRSYTVCGGGPNTSVMVFKILNDSILSGEKPANDPNDFELIEAFGMSDNSLWNVCGSNVRSMTAYIRKPEILKANPVVGASFGTDDTDCEWIIRDEAYWKAVGGPWLWSQPKANVANDVGQHNMVEATQYKSTVTSTVYKVDDGYKTEDNLQIRGMVSGTTVAEFMGYINKADEDQSLTVKSSTDGMELSGADLLHMNDSLVVVSADGTNTTKYLLEVTEYGLSSDALLTSERWEIEVLTQPKSAGESSEDGIGTISGFEYGTQLSTIVDEKVLHVPEGATMDIVDAEGAYVPLKRLNFDTAYVNVTVNSGIYLNVLAEDGLTRIVYQLQPQTAASDAFVLSDVYTVIQSQNLINFIPWSTNVGTFLSYLEPAEGASIKLVDKLGLDRIMGTMAVDDKVVVISANGEKTRVYHLSFLRSDTLVNNYFAYILSNVYDIDQVTYRVNVPQQMTTVTDFSSRITAAPGAAYVVVDSEEAEKISGNLEVGDMVMVTSGDGKQVVMYDIDILTSAGRISKNNIQFYPNPTSGKVKVSGLVSGTRVQVFNQTGTLIKDLKSSKSLEIITLDDQPTGMYLFVLTKGAQLVGQRKVILK